jgi:hypothetical protein
VKELSDALESRSSLDAKESLNNSRVVTVKDYADPMVSAKKSNNIYTANRNAFGGDV